MLTRLSEKHAGKSRRHSHSSLLMIRIRTAHLGTRSRQIRPVKVLAVAMAIFALLAVWSRWPYSTYTILRFAICATSVYLAVRSYEAGQPSWVWITGTTAALFNPFFPLRFQRGQWQILDFSAAFLFMLWAWKAHLPESEKQGQPVQPSSTPRTTDSDAP